MNSLSKYFHSDFNTQRDQWENSLLKELKLTELGSKAQKKTIFGETWPTLSLESKSAVHLGGSLPWKKAANTYAYLTLNEIKEVLTDDLAAGVRNFFFHAETLNPEKWATIEATLKDFKDRNELEVFILDKRSEHYQSSHFKVIPHLVSGQLAHDFGGHSVQELGLLVTNLIHELKAGTTNPLYLGVYLDSQFFHNIAKLRAAKLLAKRVLEATEETRELRFVALTSYRDWTMYERYSNMLRNEASVASGLIAGADHVQSAGYNTILELESENISHADHLERSRRMARNTSHILALESMLGVVEDAAFGSYHLEGLTELLCEKSWLFMQELVNLAPAELEIKIEKETSVIREKRLDMVKTRRHVMSGMNDFPDVKEELSITLRPTTLFRVARIYEELRLFMQNKQQKPEIYVAIYGDYAALNARVNFVKNYFELLGLKVTESGHGETDKEKFKAELSSRKEEIIVLCAKDEGYADLSDVLSVIEAKDKFVAGKVELANCKNLFAGQNVYDVLKDIVTRYEGKK